MEVIAIAVSIIGLLIAGGALFVSLRGTRAAERSAGEAKRSADAAEDSAASARRSATAAERGVDVQEQAYALDRERQSAEERREAERRAPSFEAKTDWGPGAFNLHGHNARLNAHLRNVGGSAAKVELAELHHVAGITSGGFMLGDTQGPQETVRELVVDPGGHLIISFEDAPLEVLRSTDERLSLDLVYSGPEGLRQRLELTLGRLPADPSRRLQWRVIDSAVRPA